MPSDFPLFTFHELPSTALTRWSGADGQVVTSAQWRRGRTQGQVPLVRHGQRASVGRHLLLTSEVRIEGGALGQSVSPSHCRSRQVAVATGKSYCNTYCIELK
jgi:hypothetical protein